MLKAWRSWASWEVLRHLLLTVLVVAGILIVYFWRLGSLTPGMSPHEVAYSAANTKIHSILINPLFAPLRLIQYGLQSAGLHTAFWLRLPSTLLGLGFLALFYWQARCWFGRFVATLATIMLAATPWFMILSRSALPQIMFFIPIALLATFSWFKRAKANSINFAWLALLVCAALSLYVPGLIWIVVALFIYERRDIQARFKTIKPGFKAAGIATKLLLVIPLIYGLAQSLSVFKSLILWPVHWASPLVIIKSTVWACLSLVWRTPYHIDTIIQRLPVLSVIQIALVVFGIYAMTLKARRVLLSLIALLVFSLIVSGLNQDINLITLGLPAIALLVAAGLRFLYTEWRSVFPYNPIPRALAVALLLILVSFQLLFGIRYTLVAWPQTVATKSVYVLK